MTKRKRPYYGKYFLFIWADVPIVVVVPNGAEEMGRRFIKRAGIDLPFAPEACDLGPPTAKSERTWSGMRAHHGYRDGGAQK